VSIALGSNKNMTLTKQRNWDILKIGRISYRHLHYYIFIILYILIYDIATKYQNVPVLLFLFMHKFEVMAVPGHSKVGMPGKFNQRYTL